MSLPTLLHYRDVFGKNFWAQPGWRMVILTYELYLPLNSAFLLALIAFFGIVIGETLLRSTVGEGSRQSHEHDFSPSEIILVGGFLYFPALLFVLTKLLHSGYTPRYGWPAILGLALGSVYLVRTIWLKSSSAYLLVALLIAFVYQVGGDLQGLRKPASSVDARWTNLAKLSRSEPRM